VVTALVGDFHIDAARLEGYGVGPLAPSAANASADGRAKNRRVELVARYNQRWIESSLKLVF